MYAKDLFSWEIYENQGITVVKPLWKEITFKNTKAFHLRMKEFLSDKETPRIVLDLAAVEILDSLSLGTLVAISKNVKQKNGEIVIASLSAPIKELFELLNFNHVFRCFDSAEEAIQNF